MKRGSLEHTILCLLILLWGIFGITGKSFADPLVSSISGTVSHNTTVTVSGKGFGTKNPVAPLLWDPVDGQYSNIVDGATVPMGGGNPWAGVQGAGMNYPPVFTTNRSRGKWIAKYSNKSRLNSGGQAPIGSNDYSAQCIGKQFYVSWWIYPTGTLYEVGSSKLFRISSSSLSQQLVYGIGSGSWVLYDSDSDAFRFHHFMSTSPDAHVWNRVETLVDNSTTVPGYPRAQLWLNSTLLQDDTAGENPCDDFGTFCTPGSLPARNICTIFTLGMDASNVQGTSPQVDFGEIYIDNTPARVEICNASTWSSPLKNHCEVQIPQGINTWTDDGTNAKLQIKVNQGSFADGATAYLYVVDASGTISDQDTSSPGNQGFSIIFGSSSSVTPPAAPAGLTVN